MDQKSGTEKFYLTIDQGTSSTKVCVFDSKGHMLSKDTREHKQIVYNEKYVEHDPNEILENCRTLIQESVNLFEKTDSEFSSKILGLSITNQRETLVVWDKATREPLYNAIVWYDKRTDEICERYIKEKGNKSHFSQINGLPISTYFTVFKLIWLLENVPDVKKAYDENRLMIGTIDTWLVYKLSKEGGHFTDRSNASRTFLYNLHSGDWDQNLLDYFGIKRDILPAIKFTTDHYGYLNVNKLEHVPIVSVMGDQQAAALGLGVIHEGDSKVTYGTGSFILTNTGTSLKFKEGFLTTVLWQFPDEPTIFGLEASIESGGSSIAYLKDNLKLFKTYHEIDLEVEDHTTFTKSIYMINFFNGVFSPYWNPKAQSMIYGLSFENQNYDVFRACIEGVCYRVAECIELLDEAKGSLKADGGMTENHYMTIFQSSLIDNEFLVSNCTQGTTMGIFIAMLVGLKDLPNVQSAEHIFPSTHKVEKIGGDARTQIQRKFQKYKELLNFVLNN